MSEAVVPSGLNVFRGPYTPRKITWRTLSIISTGSGGVGLTTVTTHVPHQLSIGDTVTITGVTGGSYSPTINGTFVVQSIDALNNQFTILSEFTSAGTHGYIKQQIDEQGVVISTGAPYNWTVPTGLRWALVSACGGGCGGAGGHATGGGGGGGGASSSCNEMPVEFTPGEVLTITTGIGGVGGAVGAAGSAALTTTKIAGMYIDSASTVYLTSGQYLPAFRPNNTTANQAQPGGATNGGRGGYGGPLYGSGNSTTGDGGPAGGAGGTPGVVGGDGAVAVPRGSYITTGGAGGGGGSTTSKGGSGGSDTMHQDNSVADNGSGGGGGSSHRGKGGLSGDSANSLAGAGEWGYGFGGGGGGGKTNKVGGDGAPGYLTIVYWPSQ